MIFESYPFYSYFLIGWIFLSFTIFPVLFKITAPYGRHAQSGWGPMINNTFGWVIMELPSVVVFAFFFLAGKPEKGVVNWIFFALWELHYVHRSLVFPFRYPNKNKQMPLLIAASAIVFNLGNNYLNGFYQGTIHLYYIHWLTDPRFIMGVIIFFAGFVINIQSDNILFRLRKPGENDYKIPQQGLFRWVSSPNYLGEIIEWMGWAIATWSLPGLAFFVWTAANLIPRAISHHQWYRTRFSNYPKGRKALIPFVV